jgi:hypothetical protein
MKAPMTKKNLSRYYEMKQEYKKQEKTLEEIQDFLSQCQDVTDKLKWTENNK